MSQVKKLAVSVHLCQCKSFLDSRNCTMSGHHQVGNWYVNCRHSSLKRDVLYYSLLLVNFETLHSSYPVVACIIKSGINLVLPLCRTYNPYKYSTVAWASNAGRKKIDVKTHKDNLCEYGLVIDITRALAIENRLRISDSCQQRCQGLETRLIWRPNFWTRSLPRSRSRGFGLTTCDHQRREQHYGVRGMLLGKFF